MRRARFERLVEEALAELPARYRKLLENIVVIVEEYPRGQRRRRKAAADKELVLGEFYGVPRTQKSVFEPGPPDQVFLYQKNIEAVCDSEEEIREQVRLTVRHELGHYFGLEEDELKHL
ncbi:metallopeptidase family protein [Acidobacteriia bacterium AH_259_A11_L15]|nr:metallopeptidase family protein [Acidobacteriia bacterium AH_259_A11_L15]